MNRQEEIKKAAKSFADALSDGLYYQSQQHRCKEHGFQQGAKWADETMIEKAIGKCAEMLINIDELLRKKGLTGQFEEEFDKEYKKFKKAMKK